MKTALGLAIVMLAHCATSACSGEASTEPYSSNDFIVSATAANAASNEPSAPIENAAAEKPPIPLPPVPSHNYQFREGVAYGYIAAISEEDRKRGKGAGDVLTFAYKGYWDGADHLEQLDPNGRVLTVSECTRPCVAIKTWAYGRIERVAYNPRSIIGAAFEDAARGRLTDSRPPPAPIPEALEEPTSVADTDANSSGDSNDTLAHTDAFANSLEE